MPGDKVLGRVCRKSLICVWLGFMISSLLLSASWNVMDPAIASRVNADTSCPLSQYAASSSMPSSLITVESTSKHIISADLIKFFASLDLFDLSIEGAVIIMFKCYFSYKTHSSLLFIFLYRQKKLQGPESTMPYFIVSIIYFNYLLLKMNANLVYEINLINNIFFNSLFGALVDPFLKAISLALVVPLAIELVAVAEIATNPNSDLFKLQFINK